MLSTRVQALSIVCSRAEQREALCQGHGQRERSMHGKHTGLEEKSKEVRKKVKQGVSMANNVHGYLKSTSKPIDDNL